MTLMSTSVLLVLMVPAAAALLVACLGANRAMLARQISLAATLLSAVLAILLTTGHVVESARAESEKEEAKKQEKSEPTFRPRFVPGSKGGAASTNWTLVDFSVFRNPAANNNATLGAIQFYLGIDGMNVWLLLLTALLMVSSVLISWNAITERVHEFHAWLLALGAGMTGVFLAFDIILFYVFFELTLVPLFFLIGIWGGPERRYAARKFFVYTLAGSLITFLGLLAIVIVCWHKTYVLTFSIPELVRLFNTQLGQADAIASERAFYQTFQFWVFLAMTAGFAIKVPLFPVHTWLPLAHVEAPTAGSVLLAGVLLKMGTYGFMRLCLPLAPDASLTIGVPLIGTLSVVGIIYGALCAKAQDDIKKLVAYSSVSHLGFCTLGMFALNSTGLTGSLMQMINHGLSTGALFLIVGMIYERYHTRLIADYSGLGSKLKAITFCMVFVSLSSVGLPGLNGFVGEALIFFGMFALQPVLAILGTLGIVLGAWYLMSMLRDVFFGEFKEPNGHDVEDITPREIATLAPIMLACLWIGLYPQPILNSMKPDVDVVVSIVQKRQEASAAQRAPVAQVRPD